MFQLKHLQHAYNGTTVLRVDEWQASQGEHWLLLGPSGSGKSTLLHVLAGLLRPLRGEVRVADQRVDTMAPAALDRFRGQTIGIVLQQLHLVASLPVEKNLLLAQYLAGLKQDRTRVAEVLANLDLLEKARAYPHELSHGQAQRVAIARAVVNRPRILLADEPTSNLDGERCAAALALLQTQAHACNATLVIATHDGRISESVPRHFELTRPR